MFLVLIFLSQNLYAQTAWVPVGKPGQYMNYADQKMCEKMEGVSCYNVGKCPMDECSLVGKEMLPDEKKMQIKKDKEKLESDSVAAKAKRKTELEAMIKGCISMDCFDALKEYVMDYK